MRYPLLFAGLILLWAAPLDARSNLGIKLRSLRSTCTLRLMAASTSPGGVDRRLRSLKRRLRRPPFRRYKSVKLLEKKRVKARQGQRRTIAFSEGQKVELRLIEPIADRKQRMRFRYHLSPFRGASPQDPGTLLTLRSGGTTLVEVDPTEEGALLVSLTCRVR